jgi:hypothetical protein
MKKKFYPEPETSPLLVITAIASPALDSFAASHFNLLTLHTWYV